MWHCDELLAEFMKYNMVTVGLVVGLLGTIFKNSRIINWLKEKIKL